MFELTFEDLAGAGDGVSLVVEKALDSQGHFNVAAAVEALAGAAFVRLELRKLALPEAENVGRDVAEPGDFADAEVELVRDVGPGGWGGFADWLVLRHARKLRRPPCRRGWPMVRLLPVSATRDGTVCNFPGLGLLNYQAPGVETGWRGSVLPRALRRYWTGQVVD